MISIDTQQYTHQGYIELPSCLFLALARIHQKHEAADVRAGFEYEDDNRLGVWHVFVDDDKSWRYVIDEEGTLRGVELGYRWNTDDDDWEWDSLRFDPVTWEVLS